MSQTIATSQSMRSHNKTHVSYYNCDRTKYYYYGAKHPLKLHRSIVTQDLIFSYGLFKKMYIYRPDDATVDDMTKFHSDNYIDFLSSIKRKNYNKNYKKGMLYGLKFPDCPVFENMFEYCRNFTGGTIAAATQLNKQKTDIAINWSGGWHHAKKEKASGFCYVNDIVLGIIELLKYHMRVLYIDIDIHHGNGVEEAFYTTDRVMTVSFHMFGDFFPGSGKLEDIGAKRGKYYTVNVPLKQGINDDNYETIFVPIISKVMEIFQPNAIVLQCGADSLAGDRLGCFNLSLKGHGKCVEFMKSYKLPLLLLGGGGYTISNVARCWTYETSIAVEQELLDDLPQNDHIEYFGPTYKLHFCPKIMQDGNLSSDLEAIKKKVFENLRMLSIVPSVQFWETAEHSNDEETVDVETNPDERLPQQDLDKRIQRENEYSDSEDEGEGGRKNNTSFRTIFQTCKVKTRTTM